MIVSDGNGRKLTATKFAKEMVAQWGTQVAPYWGEKINWDYHNLTQREVDAIDIAIAKQCDRVNRFLGVDDAGRII